MDGNRKRPIRNMKGLLKFCMQATKAEDPTTTSAFEEMSEERKKWLEEALDSMTVNTAERLTDLLKSIKDAEINTEPGTETIINALIELQDWVEDRDLARDFITLKGLHVIPGLLGSEVSEIRWRTLEMMANMCQHNPKVQLAVLGAEFLPPILLLIDEDPNPNVRVKALYALSCLSRSNVPVQTQLIEKGGLSVLVRALESGEEKIRIKASFMLCSISRDNPGLKDALLDKGLVEQMIIRLKGEHCMSHEHLMAAFVSLVEEHPRFREYCLQAKFDMKSFLNKRIEFLTGKEEFADEKTNAEELLTALNSTSQPPYSPPSTMALMPA